MNRQLLYVAPNSPQLTMYPAHNDYKAQISYHYESLFIGASAVRSYYGRSPTTGQTTSKIVEAMVQCIYLRR